MGDDCFFLMRAWFVKRGSICFFPFVWKNTLINIVIADESDVFSNDFDSKS